MFNEQFQQPKMMHLCQYLSNCVYYLENDRNQFQINLKRKRDDFNNEFASSTSTSPAKRSKSTGWHVKLATESPLHTELDTDLEDGYSTVHDIETEECRDSDDTESLAGSERTTAYATIDVLEYEIATTSEDDENDNASFCTESSATGSDALYFQTLKNIAVQALYADDSSTSGDTEDSFMDSDSADPELGRADYWECVKCKNKQNNPLYRYCERCYQVRKSHFPPRPKNKKLRQRCRSKRILSNNEHNKNSSSVNMKRKHEDSAGGSVSSSSESEIDETKSLKRASPKRRCIRTSNSNATSNKKQDCASLKLNLGIKSDEVGSSKSSSSPLSHKKLFSNNHINLVDSKNMSLNKFLGQQHDSGISSQEAGSSQEFCYTTGIQQPAMLKRQNAQIFYAESSDDQDRSKTTTTTTGKIYNTLKASPLSATSSNCSEVSIESGVSITTLKETPSSDVDQIFGNNFCSKQQQQQQPADDSNICILCFDNEKSAVFVHTKKACSGCCYTCAMKTWKKWKACPFCKEKAKNVIKLYSH